MSRLWSGVPGDVPGTGATAWLKRRWPDTTTEQAHRDTHGDRFGNAQGATAARRHGEAAS